MAPEKVHSKEVLGSVRTFPGKAGHSSLTGRLPMLATLPVVEDGLAAGLSEHD
jgi:hypothetical protein